MNRLLALFITFFLLNNCSFNENSKIWKDKEKDLSEKENVKKIFAVEEVKVSEFNQEVKLNLSVDPSNLSDISSNILFVS